MPDIEKGDNDFTAEELEQLFGDKDEESSPSPNEETIETNVNNEEKPAEKTSNIDTTKAFAKRLKESTDKARLEEREAIAKSLGYASYDEMRKNQEKKIVEDKGYDFDEISPMIEKIVTSRINSDPRLAELEELRQQKINDFGKKELAEITKLTDGEITSFDQLPQQVIDNWKKNGSLKSAYLEVEGENLITKIKSKNSKGSTNHLKDMSESSTIQSNKRLLTNEEKNLYKFFNPSMNDEELNKMLVDK